MTTYFTIDPLPLNSSDDEHYYTLTCDTGNPDKLPLKFVYDLQGLRDLKATSIRIDQLKKSNYKT